MANIKKWSKLSCELLGVAIIEKITEWSYDSDVFPSGTPT